MVHPIEKEQTWNDNLNDVIRYLFKDDKLKRLMLIPPEDYDNIAAFRDKYFVVGTIVDAILTKEMVRIVYYNDDSDDYGDHVKKRYLHFDIYVNAKHLYDVDQDRLKRRDQAIFQRLKELLLRRPHLCRLRFDYEDDFDYGTKTVGYKLYHGLFSYKTTY